MEGERKGRGGRPIGTATAVTRTLDSLDKAQQRNDEQKRLEIEKLRAGFEPDSRKAGAALVELESVENKYGDGLKRLGDKDWVRICGPDGFDVANQLTSRVGNLRQGLTGMQRTLAGGIETLRVGQDRETLERARAMIQGCLNPAKGIEEQMIVIQRLVERASRMAARQGYNVERISIEFPVESAKPDTQRWDPLEGSPEIGYRVEETS